MTLIFIFTLFASIKTYICTYNCRSWIVCTYPKVGLIYYSLFTVCLHLFLLNICTCICVYALVFIIHLFSRNAVTFNLIGFVSPLAQQSWKKNLKRNSTASLNTVLLPLTGKIHLFQGKRERLEAAHLNNQNPTKVNQCALRS